MGRNPNNLAKMDRKMWEKFRERWARKLPKIEEKWVKNAKKLKKENWGKLTKTGKKWRKIENLYLMKEKCNYLSGAGVGGGGRKFLIDPNWVNLLLYQTIVKCHWFHLQVFSDY